MSGGGYIDPNFPNPGKDGDAPFIIYGYTPSVALAISAIVLFGIATALHVWRLVRHRALYFAIPMIIATCMEIVGYVFRLLSGKKDPYYVIWFIVQYFFIVVAPVFIAASIYTVLSVLIRATSITDRRITLLSGKSIVTLFVTCDVVATIVQIAGAALIGKAESNREDPTTPNHILLGGLAFQVFTFSIYILISTHFLIKARTEVLRVTSKAFLAAFIAATLLVYLRTCFRCAETAQGLMSELMTREVYFGTLEFAPVVLAVLLFAVWHPGNSIRWAQLDSGNGFSKA